MLRPCSKTGFCEQQKPVFHVMHGILLHHPLGGAPVNAYMLSITFKQCRRHKKRLGKTGKCLPSEKKIAKPLFYRYIVPAFLSNTIY